MIEHWHWLSQEAVESPSLELFKSLLDMEHVLAEKGKRRFVRVQHEWGGSLGDGTPTMGAPQSSHGLGRDQQPRAGLKRGSWAHKTPRAKPTLRYLENAAVARGNVREKQNPREINGNERARRTARRQESWAMVSLLVALLWEITPMGFKPSPWGLSVCHQWYPGEKTAGKGGQGAKAPSLVLQSCKEGTVPVPLCQVAPGQGLPNPSSHMDQFPRKLL
ncbi:hypothetical protein QYF61_024785 [Mycteria americana]|uniref:Uncharacterized protein n=1 Tax=Mycteria americana TaxID=33587 RepID=A0AAN7SJJ2_MYCAM|nr:hypothetical protein QYF61_024785 [Mycteria americana]